MIGSLRGKVTEIDPDGELLIEVSGVGYRVAVTAATLATVSQASPNNQDADGIYLWVSQIVRDDVPRLVGFTTRDERHCFEMLLKAQGVGPALALSVLSNLPPAELRRAVLGEDPKVLMVVPGVGLRTAQRMMIDLKAKLGVKAVDSSVGSAESGGGALAEVSEALAGMGFTSQEIRSALARLPDAADDLGVDASELMRLALQATSAKS